MLVVDRTITCKECAQPFVFTEGEQRFYAERGLSHEPQRCPSCRALAKQSRRPANREYHSAICANCGNQASVPFEPQANRLVYCSSCFDQIRAAQGDRRSTGGSGGPSKPGAPSSP
jgi:CxxC-x17-CxxC domain-containing protein